MASSSVPMPLIASVVLSSQHTGLSQYQVRRPGPPFSLLWSRRGDDGGQGADELPEALDWTRFAGDLEAGV